MLRACLHQVDLPDYNVVLYLAVHVAPSVLLHVHCESSAFMLTVIGQGRQLCVCPSRKTSTQEHSMFLNISIQKHVMSKSHAKDIMA